jgi:hypothetical protein
MSRIRTAVAAMALGVSLITFGSVAVADGPRVVIEPPIFVPQSDFAYENGYYRTNEGHYYHYDHDRRGWHYGRNHEEGIRYEHEHEHEGHHR